MPTESATSKEIRKDELDQMVLRTLQEIHDLLQSDTEPKDCGGDAEYVAIEPVKVEPEVILKTEEVDLSCQWGESSQSAAAPKVSAPTKIYKCDLCSAPFSRKDNWQRHLKTHTEHRLHQCHVCHKRFPSNYAVKRHLKTHSDERQFGCTVCKKRFKDRSNLSQHMIVHNGKVPHNCRICGDHFTSRNDLRLHMMVHTGKKLYQCYVCKQLLSCVRNVETHRCRKL